MKTGIGKRLAGFLCGALLLGAAAIFGAGAETEERMVLSPGVEVLAAKTDLAVSAMRGNDVNFTEDDVARGLNLSRVNYLTVTALPRSREGELLLGSSRVGGGAVISGRASRKPLLPSRQARRSAARPSGSRSARAAVS